MGRALESDEANWCEYTLRRLYKIYQIEKCWQKGDSRMDLWQVY